MTGNLATRAACSRPLDSSDQRHEFLSLYQNRAHHIYKAPGDPKWKSSRVPLATGLIDAAVSNQCDTFYGAYWADQTRFAVLDIDECSKYHNAQELRRLRTDLASVGLYGTAIYQSSISTGWHLYIPFTELAPSKDIEQILKVYLKATGYEVIGGQLEIFPSGNALRLPLQSGFAWLDDAGAVILRREDIGQEAAISRFLCDLRDNANNWHATKTQIDSRLNATAAAAGDEDQDHIKAISGEGFDDLFSSRLIRENYEKGRQYWRDGLTEKNQRHEAVICIEHYLWHGDQAAGLPAYPGRFNDQRRYRLLRAWLQENHNGFCNHINAGEWQIVEAQIRRACAWRRDEKTAATDREPYPLTERAQEVLQARSMATGRTWTIDDLKKGNEGRERKARKKIMRAVTACLSDGRQISRKTLQLMTGCSPNTLRKHADLWKLLAAGSGDKNLGGAGGLSVLPAAVGSERDFLNQEFMADSGDLELNRQEQVGGFSEAVSKKLEIIEVPLSDSCADSPALAVAPPFLLPGLEPTSESPASKPNPAGCFASFDAGSPLRWYSDRAADGAGGDLLLCSSGSAVTERAVNSSSIGVFNFPTRVRKQFLACGYVLEVSTGNGYRVRHSQTPRAP